MPCSGLLPEHFLLWVDTRTSLAVDCYWNISYCGLLSEHIVLWIVTQHLVLWIVTRTSGTVDCYRNISYCGLLPEHLVLWIVIGTSRTVDCYRNISYCGLLPELLILWIVTGKGDPHGFFFVFSILKDTVSRYTILQSRRIRTGGFHLPQVKVVHSSRNAHRNQNLIAWNVNTINSAHLLCEDIAIMVHGVEVTACHWCP